MAGQEERVINALDVFCDPDTMEKLSRIQDDAFVFTNASLSAAFIDKKISKDEFIGYMVTILGGMLADFASAVSSQGTIVFGSVGNEAINIVIAPRNPGVGSASGSC